jgi:hypothetical protein
LEFICPINAPSSRGHVFILVSIDYFTNWVEVLPLKNAKDEQVISFLETNIFSRVGPSIEIISNNGVILSNFGAGSMLSILHLLFTTYKGIITLNLLIKN